MLMNFTRMYLRINLCKCDASEGILTAWGQAGVELGGAGGSHDGEQDEDRLGHSGAGKR
jgi:hypothetical protein